MKKTISIIMTLVLMLSTLFSANVFAASEKVIATSQINVYKDTACKTKGTSSPKKSYNAYISKNDDVLTIKKVTSSYVQVQFPTKSGVKTGYIKRSDYNRKTKEWSYSTRISDFQKDKRFKEDASWGTRSPILAQSGRTGCCAYAADFAYYVFGKTTQSSGTKFTKPKDIRAGDVIQISGHWFVVLERNGNKLKTAEGNWTNGKVRISSTAYKVKNSVLYRGDTKLTFKNGYHFQ